MVKAVLHLCCKSLYEQVRSQRIQHPKTYLQFYVDVYYFYTSCVFLSHYLFSGVGNLSEFDLSMLAYKEEHHNLQGLVNEIICSAIQRISNPVQKHELASLDEQLMLTICESHLQKLLELK